MKIKNADRKYFTQELGRLADTFNDAVAVWKTRKPVTAAEEKAQKALRKIYAAARSLQQEFYEQGYTRAQWNLLITASGVEKRMEPYGQSFMDIPGVKHVEPHASKEGRVTPDVTQRHPRRV